ncbi:Tudor domain-containing protein 7A [Nymphon striatum]|nr:Tudor domain-containing protein 7A [Nymphon striatum]
MDMYLMDTPPLASSVEVHKIYAAKIDESWLRVGVLELQSCGTKVQIMLLDHGDIEVVACNVLYVLDDRFRTLPYQALRCQLYGLDNLADSNDAWVAVISRTRGKSFVAEIVSRDEPISLILFDTSTDEDININDEICLLASEEKVTPELPKVGGIKEVYICHAEVDGTVYINIENPYLDLLNQEISNIAEKADVETHVGEGILMTNPIKKMYLAKYDEDENWYRAIVSERKNDGTVKVDFVDYGNSCIIPVTNLRDLEGLSTTLNSLPPQAIPCTLHSLPAEGYEWTEKAVDKLITIAPDDIPLLLKVITAATSDKPAVVELFKRIEPNNELVSVNTTLLFQTELFNKLKIKKESSDSASSDNSSTDNTDNIIKNKAFSRRLPSPIPIIDNLETKICAPHVPIPGEYYDVIVTQAANPFNFTCQPWREMSQLKELMEKMQRFYYSTTVGTDLLELRTGSFYAGKTSNGQWCRIFLHDINNKDPIEVSAYLIDYGEYAVLPSSDLQPLKSEFTKLPYMAVKAKLYDIIPTHGDWTPMECIEFQKLVTDKEFVSKIKEKSIDATSGLSVYQVTVSLIDTSIAGQDIYIERELVKKGIAKHAI